MRSQGRVEGTVGGGAPAAYQTAARVMLTPSSSLFLMTRLHPSVALIAHLSGQVAGDAFTSPDGRYQAAEVGGDTVIVDLRDASEARIEIEAERDLCSAIALGLADRCTDEEVVAQLAPLGSRAKGSSAIAAPIRRGA